VDPSNPEILHDIARSATLSADARTTVERKKRKHRESFGAIRRLPSGRYQASYVGPDMIRHTAPSTFLAITDARAWLAGVRADIHQERWRGPAPASRVDFMIYARQWIDTRVNAHGEPLRARSVVEYQRLLNGPLSEFTGESVRSISPEKVRRWYSDQSRSGKLTQSARAYTLLKAVMGTAVGDRLVEVNPCQVKGATKAKTGKSVEPPTRQQLAAIVGAMDARFRLLVQVAAWGGLRWGEVTELRHMDVRSVGVDGDLVALDVSRAVTYTKAAGYYVGAPKSKAGIRSVTLPLFLTDALVAHLEKGDPRSTGLLFPSAKDADKWMSSGSFSKFWEQSRRAAGRQDMPFHALRHFGATQFGQQGATLREIQARLGHSTVEAAMRYQHEAGRDAELARRMSHTDEVPDGNPSQ
jgi:integrase